MKRRNFLKGLGGIGAILTPMISMGNTTPHTKEIAEELTTPSEITNASFDNFTTSLKINRNILHSDLTHFCEDVAVKGSYVESFTTDDGFRVVRPGQNGGVSLGVLLNDVVNLDLTRQRIAWHRNEVQIGGKVEVCTGGILTIKCSGNPKPNMLAYYNKRGVITTEKKSKAIGAFLSYKDEDGFAQVEIR